MTATVKTWAEVKELLHEAIQLSAAERASFLDRVCTADPALRGELESLLSSSDALPNDFLSAAAPFLGEVNLVLEEGGMFAEHFRLVRRLGEGGMGQVWLAEQTAPVRRSVALKLIKAGTVDSSVVHRFKAERQSLAIMDHPAIARVFDAGATPQGQPYFVMEYVPGLPITDYCDERRLGIPARLELFMQTCDGVQHAHQKGVIHRDLKPANILVVEVDGKPTVRIIDFGLAKAIAPAAGEAQLTQFALFAGTPGYMSPEQLAAGSSDVDTRTDVYSLGVILYVLLTGSTLFDAKRWRDKPLDEVLRHLREDEPAAPSSRFRVEGSEAMAEARGGDRKKLARQLGGDLDAITMRALAKDRSLRYASPSELVADLKRFLAHVPIAARPASAGYQMRKYVRRHRVAVGAAALLMLLLGAFSVVLAIAVVRISRERDRATRITDFMTGMFKVSDPSEARGNSVTAREILDKASKDMGAGLALDPEAQTQMMHVMASTYTNLGLYPRARALAQPAVDVRKSLLGADDPRTLESMSLLGWILARQGRDGEAEAMERQALEGERRKRGAEDPLTLETMDHLGVILQHQGDFQQAEVLEREVAQAAIRRLGAESPLALQAMNHLGNALMGQGRYSEGEQQYRRLLDVERRIWGADHPESLKALANLAWAVSAQNRLPEGEELYRESLALQRRVLGPDHQNTIVAMQNLANFLSVDRQAAEGEQLLRDALAALTRTLGPDHPHTLNCQNNLAEVLYVENNFTAADSLHRQTLAARIRVLGPEHRDTLLSRSNLAQALIAQGHYDEAERYARDAFSALLRTAGPLDQYTLDALKQLGKVLGHERRYDEAEQLFRNVIASQPASTKRGDPWLVWYAFASAAAAAGRSDDAIQYVREAVARGYSNADGLLADRDLKELQSVPHFQELVASIRHPPAPAGAPAFARGVPR
jgi:non-specific serine/threonine protein kinase/serine/threonine-protein kinase